MRYFPSDFLQARLKFLKSRAEFHYEHRGQGLERLAISGTLCRDAAAVALLLGDGKEARTQLLQAGRAYLELGLVYGASLIALTGSNTADSYLSGFEDVVENMRSHSYEERSHAERLERPMADKARSTPRQLLALLQFDYLVGREHVSDEKYVMTLERNGGYPVGNTGITVSTYVKLCEALTESSAEKSIEISSETFRELALISSIRSEAIRAGASDIYHWRKLLRPSELIDFDSVILISIGLSNLGSAGLLEQLFLIEEPYSDAPLKAAKLLRSES